MDAKFVYNWQLSCAVPLKSLSISSEPVLRPRVEDMHEAIHLGCVLSGDQTGIIGGHRLETCAGEFYLTAPWEPHGTVCSRSGFRLLLLTLSYDEVERFLFTGREALVGVCCTPPPERMKLLKKWSGEFAGKHELTQLAQTESGALRDLRLWHWVLGFFIALAEKDLNWVPNAAYARLLPAQRCLGRQLTDVGRAASACNLSEGRFSHLFREVFGIPFARYERLYRLRRAAAELNSTGAGLDEVAANWGFCDKSHFSRLYRQIYGTGPRNRGK